jgi:hypothetical protein
MKIQVLEVGRQMEATHIEFGTKRLENLKRARQAQQTSALGHQVKLAAAAKNKAAANPQKPGER